MLSEEQIQHNFDKFRSLCEKLGHRSNAALALIDHFDTRLALAPASSSKKLHAAYPGGLVEHSLRVLGNAIKLNNAFDWKLSKESMIIGCLFHDIGKLGSLTTELYIDSEKWRKEKLGEMYQYNTSLEFMTVPHRSIFFCQHFGLRLKHDEMLAILLNDGFVVEENKAYCLKDPWLSTCIMTADIISTREEGENDD